MSDVCKLYIIHAWQFGAEYNELIKLLKTPYFKYYNYSGVDELKSNYPTKLSTEQEIEEFMKSRIALAQVVIVLSCKYYEFTEPIQTELKFAQEYNKPIIAMYSKKHNDIPHEIATIATVVVDWQSSDLINAISDNIQE